MNFVYRIALNNVMSNCKTRCFCKRKREKAYLCCCFYICIGNSRRANPSAYIISCFRLIIGVNLTDSFVNIGLYTLYHEI